jgi:type I restriction enzyme R subunit
MNETDTCREYVLPRLEAAGWDYVTHPIIEQKSFTDGRILPTSFGRRSKRLPQKRADYLLGYTRDYTIAVVEAKADYKLPADGLQQAKDYAEILGLKFAFATNGRGIIEYDYFTGLEREIDAFPSPDELWKRLRIGQGIDDNIEQKLLEPSYLGDKKPRYYQEIAINRTLEGILKGKKRLLITMATGTGKTFVASQICWKLWRSRWNRAGKYRKPRILYLSDRNILIDDPKEKDFVVFDDARYKIENGQINTGREMYFAIYQALAKDTERPGLYREYDPDFFDLVIVDECHRGSARDESNWREILEYFHSAYQLGMTATPKRDDNVDTYSYFGDPLYTYSLSQGIEDGFLAPYRVHRIVTNYDATGWRPSPGELDRYGRVIPEKDYQTQHFEREVALRQRTRAIAGHLTEFLKKTDRFAKTIVFCVDQEHADEMRRELNNLNTDLTKSYPDYVCRVTADEGDIGRGHLSRFQDVETASPVILTTSQLLTTGVDAPTCQNIVLARVINSMTEFKQIIGRGTRVRTDYGKYYFNILDYTGSATTLFADPAFDGEPVRTTQIEVDGDGNILGSKIVQQDEMPDEEDADILTTLDGAKQVMRERNKYYYDGGKVEITAEGTYELDVDGNRLRIVRLTDYTAERVRSIYPNAAALRAKWADPQHRGEIIKLLEEKGISFEALAAATNQPDADPFDLLCFIVFGTPLRTRRERANALRRKLNEAFKDYREEARAILDMLLEKYAEYGTEQFKLPSILKVPPISDYGTSQEIASMFGGNEQLREAIRQLQVLLYAEAA